MNFMKKAAARGKNCANKVNSGLLGLAVVLTTGVSSVANAAVPTEASTAITGLATDGAALIAEFWPVATAIVVSLVLFKLFKKGTGAAT